MPVLDARGPALKSHNMIIQAKADYKGKDIYCIFVEKDTSTTEECPLFDIHIYDEREDIRAEDITPTSQRSYVEALQVLQEVIEEYADIIFVRANDLNCNEELLVSLYHSPEGKKHALLSGEEGTLLYSPALEDGAWPDDYLRKAQDTYAREKKEGLLSSFQMK